MCELYNLHLQRCAAELFSFAEVYEKFDHEALNLPETNDPEVDDDVDDNDDENVEEDAMEELEEDDLHLTKEFEGADDGSERNKERSKLPSFSDALHLLCDPQYHLIDAFPVLRKVHAITVAMPTSSSTAEIIFSALKKVKTRIRSTMVEERQEGLMLMPSNIKFPTSLAKKF